MKTFIIGDNYIVFHEDTVLYMCPVQDKIYDIALDELIFKKGW